MATQRLDAAEREHEATRRLHQSAPNRHRTRHVEGGRDLARCANADAIARIDADQRVIDEIDALGIWEVPCGP